MITRILFILIIAGLVSCKAFIHPEEVSNYNIKWESQSKNSGESMPCGGGDIGMNVWVESGQVFMYMSRSGTFDENNAFLKLGRIRLKLTPDPFSGSSFKQELDLRNGCIQITGSDGDFSSQILVWVDVYHPVAHIEINANKEVTTEVWYESWRYRDRTLHGRENNANSYKWAPRGEVILFKDEIGFDNNGVMFYHRNRNDHSVFDVTVKQQGLDSLKPHMFNPLKDLTFGGFLTGSALHPAGTSEGRYLETDFKAWKLQCDTPQKEHNIDIYLHTGTPETIGEWKSGLTRVMSDPGLNRKKAFNETRRWWHQYWDRSFILIQPGRTDIQSAEWKVGRNYQLFRYMLGCNAYGQYPTKFNGGLFTYDPCLVDSTMDFTPDHRNWGGGTMTAQNQRLVYFPMLKSGDFDYMKPQFDFYLRSLGNAEMRSQIYWNHQGACFTEQLENFGLPNCTEYGWNRPEGYPPGLQYNKWLEYQWDTALEFCLMILETNRYAGKDISLYIPLIESCLTFFNEHYKHLALEQGNDMYDEHDHLVLYPGSACETYKLTKNATPTIAALKTVLKKLLELPDDYLTPEKRTAWKEMLKHIPPIPFRVMDGYKTIAPAESWERVNNTESPQLYPVFPWGIYGVGQPDIEWALNTWKYDPDVVRFRDYIGWKQDNIFAARLGLTKEATELILLKLQDSGRRFPAFWGPGFDWVPDHNHGGSGMIGLQEMLLQSVEDKIYLFPAWPETWDVHFKLHAPGNTTVECEFRDGKIQSLKVIPKARLRDIVRP